MCHHVNCRTHEHRHFERKWRHASASHTWLRAVKVKETLLFCGYFLQGKRLSFGGVLVPRIPDCCSSARWGFCALRCVVLLSRLMRESIMSLLFQAGPFFSFGRTEAKFELLGKELLSDDPRCIFAPSEEVTRVRRADASNAVSPF